MYTKIYIPEFIRTSHSIENYCSFFGKRHKSFIRFQRPELQAVCSRERAKRNQPLHVFNHVTPLFHSPHHLPLPQTPAFNSFLPKNTPLKDFE